MAEKEYIERETAIKAAVSGLHGVPSVSVLEMVEALEGVPAANVVEVKTAEAVADDIAALIDEQFRKDLQLYHDAIEPTDGEEIKRIFNSHIISAETYRQTIANLIREYKERDDGTQRTN